MWDQIKKFKDVIVALTILGSMSWGAMNYFTPQTVFAEHVRKQELNQLYDKTMKLQMNYNCYLQSCAPPVMPPELYEAYMDYIRQIQVLENK